MLGVMTRWHLCLSLNATSIYHGRQARMLTFIASVSHLTFEDFLCEGERYPLTDFAMG